MKGRIIHDENDLRVQETFHNGAGAGRRSP